MSLLRYVIKRGLREISTSRQRSLLIVLCIAIGISSVAAVQFYGYSIMNFYSGNIKSLNGGDISIYAKDRLRNDQGAFLEEGRSKGRFDYTVVREIQDFIMTESDSGQSAMVTVKRVDPRSYPLYGKLTTSGSSDPLGGRRILARGRALVSASALSAIGAGIGDKVVIQGKTYVVGGELGADSAMDTIDTGIVGRVVVGAKPEDAGWEMNSSETGGRVRLFLRVKDPRLTDGIANEAGRLFNLKAASRGRSPHSGDPDDPEGSDWKAVSTYKETQDEIVKSMKNLSDAVMIVGLASLLLGGLGIFSAVNMMVRQRFKDIAVTKCIGGSTAQIIAIFGVQVLILSVAGIALGLAAGVGLATAIPNMLRDLMPLKPDLSLHWLTLGRITLLGILVATLFSVLPILDISKVRPLMVYRDESTWQCKNRWDKAKAVFLVILMAGVFGSVISMLVGSAKVGFGFAYGILAFISLMYLPVRLMVFAACKFPPRRNIPLKLGLRNLERQGGRAASSVLSIAIGIGAVVLVTILQVNVVGVLKDSLNDAKSYNVFVAGAPKSAVSAMEKHLAGQDYVETFTSVPMVSGEFVELNGKPLDLQRYDRAAANVLSHASLVGSDSKNDLLKPSLVSGRWLRGSSGPSQLIVPEDLAEKASLKVGDKLKFKHTTVGGIQYVPFTIVGISTPERPQAGIGVSFSAGMITRKEDIGKGPMGDSGRDILAVRTKEGVDGSRAASDIRKAFPGIGMVIDLGQMLDMFYKVIGAMTKFMQFIGLFSVLSGGIILAGMIVLTKYQRRRDIAILRCLGGDTGTVLASNLWEYGVVGFLAGGIGVLASNVVVAEVFKYVIRSPFRFDPAITFGSLMAAIVFTSVIGMLSIADVLGEKPLSVLKYE